MDQILCIGTEDRANELINFVSEIFVCHHQKYEKCYILGFLKILTNAESYKGTYPAKGPLALRLIKGVMNE